MRPVLRIMVLIMSAVLWTAGSYAQDEMPAPTVPVQPMDAVLSPAHLSPGLAVDLDFPASYLYPDDLSITAGVRPAVWISLEQGPTDAWIDSCCPGPQSTEKAE